MPSRQQGRPKYCDFATLGPYDLAASQANIVGAR